MAIKINFNINSLISQKYLNQSTEKAEKAMLQLSSGVKINYAKDNPVVCSISDKLKAQINANEQLITNYKMSADMLSTAEGGINTINEHLLRIRELSLQGSTGIYSTLQRTAIINEITSRLDEIDRLVGSTKFDNLYLFDGSCENIKLQIGTNSSPEDNTIDITSILDDTHISTLGLSNALFETPSEMQANDFANYLDNITGAMNILNDRLAKIGTVVGTLETNTNTLTEFLEIQNSYCSDLIDTDYAQTVSELTKQQIIQNINVAITQQANQIPQIAMQLLGG